MLYVLLIVMFYRMEKFLNVCQHWGIILIFYALCGLSPNIFFSASLYLFLWACTFTSRVLSCSSINKEKENLSLKKITQKSNASAYDCVKWLQTFTVAQPTRDLPRHKKHSSTLIMQCEKVTTYEKYGQRFQSLPTREWLSKYYFCSVGGGTESLTTTHRSLATLNPMWSSRGLHRAARQSWVTGQQFWHHCVSHPISSVLIDAAIAINHSSSVYMLTASGLLHFMFCGR